MSASDQGKARAGNFFEDFTLGQVIRHATPRTIDAGEVALYTALYGPRFAVQSSAEFARALGYRTAPIDDLLVFHIVFGKSVPDVSLNAVANLGYAECRFLAPVYPGDTLRSQSRVIGLKQNSSGKTGIVYVRTTGTRQDGVPVVEFTRWVMVRKHDPGAPAPDPVVPELAERVAPADLVLPQGVTWDGWNADESGSHAFWDDYAVGERIDHRDAMTITEAEHMLATRLYQNTARVHFNRHQAAKGRFGQPIVYGGHVISLARALSFNGLANGALIAAVNAGSHVAPAFAGDTVYGWSEIIERAELPGRSDVGALRIRTIATKDRVCDDFPGRDADGKYDEAVLLDFDYWAWMPRRGQPETDH